MSNWELQAEVDRLRSQLNEIERANAELRSEVNTAIGGITAGEASLVSARTEIQHTLTSASSSLAASHQRVIEAYEMQQEIDVIYQRMKNMEAANKAIRRCNNTKYYDFAGYRKVRKIVQGMMDNLDLSMINESVIERAIEKEHLQNPDYWLTAVLIAVAAWKDDQRERAQRALARAMELDLKKTASFLLIFNLRMGREEAAFKWFDLLTQQPLLGSDTTMILLFFSLLSHTIEDRVSDASYARVSTYMKALVSWSLENSATSGDAAVRTISDSMAGLTTDRSFPYPTIERHAGNAGQLRTSLALARNNAHIIDFVNDAIHVDETVRNEYLKTYIEMIVEMPSDVEQSVYDEIAANELIIKYQGDLEAAHAAWEASKVHDESVLDLVGEMVRWVYTAEGRQEANPQMRRNMLVLTRELQQQAGAAYVHGYQELFTPRTTVSIDSFQGPCDLTRTLDTMPAVEAHYQGIADAAKAQVKDVAAYVAIGVGVAVAIAALVFAPAEYGPLLAVLGGFGVIAGIVMIVMNQGKRKQIDAQREQSVVAARGVLEQLAREAQALGEAWYAEDLLSVNLTDLLGSL